MIPIISRKSISLCKTEFFWTLEPAPTSISSLSPRKVAPNQPDVPANNLTLLIKLASGVTQKSPIGAVLPLGCLTHKPLTMTFLSYV